MGNKYSSDQTENTSKCDKREKFIRTNYKIFNEYSRVIEEGRPARIMKTSAAIEYAESLGLDLVEIGYDRQNRCSNCKVIDFQKWKYEQKKQEKLAKKQARANASDLKSLQLTLTTDVADRDRLIRHAKEFLVAGDRVKISVRFRNRREFDNVPMAKDILRNVVIEFDGIAVLDAGPTLNGKELSCILRKA